MVCEISNPISTVMACSNQSAPGHFESTNDRGVRNDETVIPEDTKSDMPLRSVDSGPSTDERESWPSSEVTEPS